MRILVVEDEEHLSVVLKFNFEAEGYDVVAIDEGPAAVAAFQAADPPFDLVILDLMLPGMSGYEVCRQIRKVNAEIPILVLSARTLSEDKIQAFDAGTDQYVTKPFELRELLARVRNLFERRVARSAAGTTPAGGPAGGPAEPAAPGVGSDVYRFGDAVVDFSRFEVTVAGARHHLSEMEFRLLRYFVQHEGRVVSRQELFAKVWGLDRAPQSRTVDNFLLRLRKVFEKDPSRPRHFVAYRGAGYRFLAAPGDASPEEETVSAP